MKCFCCFWESFGTNALMCEETIIQNFADITQKLVGFIQFVSSVSIFAVTNTTNVVDGFTSFIMGRITVVGSDARPVQFNVLVQV